MASKKKKSRSCADIIRFYLTAFFILLASFSSFAFIFLVPFVIDPGFATLFAEFDTEPLTCVTVESTSLFGQSNCSWSSCREGCTRDIFECTQIYVNYFRDKNGISSGKKYTDLSSVKNVDWQFTYAKIFPNVKGCGYPPSVNCTHFNDIYKEIGSTFPCYYSKVHPNITITHLNLEETKENLIYAIAIPWGCFIASVLYLLVTYVGFRKPDETYTSSKDTSSKASKEASNYSLRSISKSLNQGVTKMRKDTDDKGRYVHQQRQQRKAH